VITHACMDSPTQNASSNVLTDTQMRKPTAMSKWMAFGH